jgi:hypothetical protein
MQVREPGLQFYVDLLNADRKFSFVRYGNGEWDCIFGTFHKTRSGSQTFTPQLRQALEDSIVQAHRADNYFMAIQNAASLEKSALLGKVEGWLSGKPPIDWHLGDVFHRASSSGQLAPLVDALSTQRVVIVGPPWLMSLPFASVFVPVEPQNCWDQVDEIAAQLSKLSNAVISFSAGPAAKVLIYRLFPIIGSSCWLLDFGSLWDPYCGVKSRNYHKLMDDQTLKTNLSFYARK